MTAVRDDDELGRVRFCRRCGEWWPDDAEFWFYTEYRAGDVAVARGQAYVRRTSGQQAQCRGCHSELNARGRRRRRARQIPPVFMAEHGCPQCRLVIVPAGRVRCHGCARRMAGPMTAAMIAERYWWVA